MWERLYNDSFFLWNLFVNALESIILTNNTLVLSDREMKYCDKKVTIRKTGKMGNGHTRRVLTKEYKNMLKNPNNNYTVTWDEYNERQRNVIINGPQGSPHENGIFNLQLEFGMSSYPGKPPRISFKTRIYHPNVNKNVLQFRSLAINWGKKMKNIRELLDVIVDLLTEPDCVCFVNDEAAAMCVSDREKFNQIAQKVTKQFAIPK